MARSALQPRDFNNAYLTNAAVDVNPRRPRLRLSLHRR